MRSLYYGTMVNRLIKLLKRHKKQVLTNHPVFGQSSTSSNGHTSNGNGVHTCTTSTNGIVPVKTVPVPLLSTERDRNGFPIDTSKLPFPDERMWTAKIWKDFDEYYTRLINK